MLNTITIMGRLTRDPEIRTTSTGKHVASFTLAVERDFAQNGQKETDFLDCVAWNSSAEFVSRYFHKGQLVAVTGRLQIRNWEDNDGAKRKSAEIIVSGTYFAEAKKQAADPTADFPEIDSDEALPFLR